MVRPATPWRGAGRTMGVLKRLAQQHGEAVEIHIFGCSDAAIEEFGLDRDFHFTNHGVLVHEDVANLLRFADMFIDLSTHQAFGLTALEAMACGCAVVVPLSGGAAEYAVDGENSLVVDTGMEEDCLQAATRLIAGPELRRRLQTVALQTAAKFTLEGAAASQLGLFSEFLATRRGVETSGGATFVADGS